MKPVIEVWAGGSKKILSSILAGRGGGRLILNP
jgi:hypothetical protein